MPALDIPTILGKIHILDDGNPSQPVVVLWPSLFTSHTFYRKQLPALRSEGFRTIAIDPPGHGQSSATGLFTMDQCVQALEEILTARGVKEYSFIGTSWGGFIGIRLAQPSKVVILNSSGHAPSLFERVRATLLVHLLWWPSLDGLVNQMVAGMMLSKATKEKHPMLGDAIMKGFRAAEREGYCNAVQSVLVDREAATVAVKNPLVICGSEDGLLPPAYAKEIAEKSGGTLHTLEVAHLAALEAPEEVNELILGYLKS